jgi:CDP-diacylglycerol---glycerol-3-phosphate 3-phosphatidyltransferase
MNLPNKLTVSRIGIACFMAVFLTFPSIPWGKTMALLLFVVASLTDYWDGRLARRMNRVTAFGQLMDPLADKILVCAAFVGFVAVRQIVPAWVVITIISREFLVTGLRLLAVREGRIVEAGRLGKHKTAWQIAVIVAIMTGLSVREDWLPLFHPNDTVDLLISAYNCYFDYITYGLSLLAATLTVVSGAAYLRQNRDLLLKDV